MHLYRCVEVLTVNPEYKKALGERIRDLRNARGLTQEQVSAQLQIRGCDITRSALAKIEVGQRHVYADELKVFREVLNVSYEDLLI